LNGSPWATGATRTQGSASGISAGIRALPLDMQAAAAAAGSSAGGGRRGSSKVAFFRQGSINLTEAGGSRGSNRQPPTTAFNTSEGGYSLQPPAGSLVLPPSILKSFQIIRDLRY
jgi:hypothetical protein